MALTVKNGKVVGFTPQQVGQYVTVHSSTPGGTPEDSSGYLTAQGQLSGTSDPNTIYGPQYSSTPSPDQSQAQSGTTPTGANTTSQTGPSPTPAQVSPPTTPTTTPPTTAQSYTVKQGDTLGGIAQQAGMTLGDLLKMNQEYQKNPNLIRPGQQVSLAPKYQGVFDTLKGKTPQDQAGVAKQQIGTLTQPPVDTGALPTTPAVDAFMGSPGVLATAQQIMSILDPQSTRQDLIDQMNKVKSGQDTVSADQLQLMNIKNVMSGTTDDIRSEITKAGGTATESQVQALATSRNAVLIKQATFLQDQLSYHQSLVQNDQSLLDFERQMANDQFSQRYNVLNMVQTNQTNMQNAAIDRFNNLVKNAGGYTAAAEAIAAQDPSGASLKYYSQLTGANLTSNAWLTQADKYSSAKIAYEQARATAALATAASKAATPSQPSPTGGAVGTTGSPYVDSTLPGYATTPIVGNFTQAAIDQDALATSLGQPLPVPLGLSSTGVAGTIRAAINNRMAEMSSGGNIAANKAQLAALSASLKKQTDYLTSTQRALTGADNSFAQVLNTFSGVVNDQSMPIANILNNYAKYGLGGSMVPAYKASLAELGNEYQQVFSRGGQVTDTVRKTSQDIIDGNISINDLKKVNTQLQAQGQIVVAAAQQQVDSINGQISNIVGGGKPGVTKGGLSDNDFVNQALTEQHISWTTANAAVPPGQIGVLLNATGQLGYISPNEFDPSLYTRI